MIDFDGQKWGSSKWAPLLFFCCNLGYGTDTIQIQCKYSTDTVQMFNEMRISAAWIAVSREPHNKLTRERASRTPIVWRGRVHGLHDPPGPFQHRDPSVRASATVALAVSLIFGRFSQFYVFHPEFFFKNLRNSQNFLKNPKILDRKTFDLDRKSALLAVLGFKEGPEKKSFFLESISRK